MEIKTKLIPMTWLPDSIPHGYACGYVGVPPDHPWYKKDYDDIEVDVHGGLTWSDNSVGDEPANELWWVGFDPAHYGDTQENCNEQYCLKEVEKLKQQAIEAYEKLPKV